MSKNNNQLVIIQPTPFCNIDCTYCYLPHRASTERISMDTLAAIFSQICQSQQFIDPITIVWHAGEPLTIPPSFYYQAFDLANSIAAKHHRRLIQSIQTNATLINSQWIELFKKYEVGMGVSLDGPAFIHDKHRVTRSGRGTHKQVMSGIHLLQEANIPFSVIAVLTNFALDYPDEIFNFFLENDIDRIAFNVDEMEGIHLTTSYVSEQALTRYKSFMKRFLRLLESSRGKLRVREFQGIYQRIMAQSETTGAVLNSTNRPMQIITFDYHGNYSTFCPELRGAPDGNYSNFIMGNVLQDRIDQIDNNQVFKKINDEVQKGVAACQRNCQYWQMCGGGSPSNKYFECGRFDVTETTACKIHKQALTDVVLEYVEETLIHPFVAHNIS